MCTNDQDAKLSEMLPIRENKTDKQKQRGSIYSVIGFSGKMLKNII